MLARLVGRNMSDALLLPQFITAEGKQAESDGENYINHLMLL